MLEGVNDVGKHGEVHLPLLVIPVKVQSKVVFSFPFARNLIDFSQDGHDAISIFFANIFHTKFIHTQRKAYRAPLVRPEPGCDLALIVSLFF